ncbi:MAG TPA: DsrE/DsrF/DrsH-like family protein [Rhodothermales bacterium]|nr:DsrE/DsrF/DrsH-like family protein [Rhodothermales bacterium]
MEVTAATAAHTQPDIKERHPVKKVLVICSKGTLEDVYAALIMANGALMEGIEASLFFTFFGLDALHKEKQDHLHTATVGNPAFMRHLPTMVGGLPGFEAVASTMMRKEMDKLDIPPVSEFLEMIVAGGGKIYGCLLAVEMFKLSREDFIDDLEDIITVGDMYALAEGEGTQIIFI